MKALLVADPSDRDLGLLGDFLDGAGVVTRYADRGGRLDDEAAADLLVLLGSNRSAHSARNAQVVTSEMALIRRSLQRGTPVMGICYGAQVLARALGGSSRRGRVPECGWLPVSSSDEELCTSGRWAQMHHDVIVPSLTSTVIGWSPAGPQAFTDDSFGTRAIGWQFHPELTLPTFERWLSQRYSGSEGADAAGVLADARRYAGASAPRAAALFRSAFRYLGVGSRVEEPS